MHPYISMAVKAARQASHLLLRGSEGNDQRVLSQKPNGTVSIDCASLAEKSIAAVIQRAYPDHGIFGAEEGWLHKKNAPITWYIDAIDGKVNFVKGIPHYAICMAVMDRGVVSHGLIYDPNMNELFTAVRGVGAFLNNRRIRVSTTTQIKQSLLSFYQGENGDSDSDKNTNTVQLLYQSGFALYMNGSPALAFCGVAAGRLDAFCGLNLQIGNTAPGSLMLIESGGLISDLSDEKNYLHSGCLVGGTPKLVTPLEQLMKKN